MYSHSNKSINYGSKLSPSDTRRYMKVRGLGRIVSGGTLSSLHPTTGSPYLGQDILY